MDLKILRFFFFSFYELQMIYIILKGKSKMYAQLTIKKNKQILFEGFRGYYLYLQCKSGVNSYGANNLTLLKCQVTKLIRDKRLSV